MVDMKNKLLPVAIAVLVAASNAFGSDAAKESPKPLKVLMIGNSFSICCLTHTPSVAKDMGCPLDMVSLYIGGCSLERHCSNIAVASTNDMFRPYRTTWSYASLEDQSAVPFAASLTRDEWTDGRTGRLRSEMKSNIPAMLVGDRWDVVTIQQASHLSWNKESYHPWGDDLVAKIRELAPQARIVVQETWSYPPWDGRLKQFGFDQVDMYARLRDAYAEFAGKYGFDVIPTGTAAEFCPDRNKLFTAPDFHFNKVQGEYLQALVWTAKLFDVDVTKCAYRPEKLDAARADELKRAAMDAVLSRSSESERKMSWSLVRRAYRDERPTRGNTNILKLQPIDDASWIWMPGDDGLVKGGDVKFMAFRCDFESTEADGTLVLDVSADERYMLYLDGILESMGPNRSTVENWQYNTYISCLKPGKHTMSAFVWKTGDHGPLAQLSCRGGFILKAGGAYDAKLTTGKAKWTVARQTNVKPSGKDDGAWGTGSQFTIAGSWPGRVEDIPAAGFKPAAVVRGGAGRNGPLIYGTRTDGWMLFPSQIPDQMMDDSSGVPPCGTVRAVTRDASWRGNHVYTEEETKDPLVGELNRQIDPDELGTGVVIPAHTRIQAAWDMARYQCVYPFLICSKGKGARVSLSFTESPRDGRTKRKGDRSEIVGRYLQGFGDTFVCDGREYALFTSPWFRCGRWCRIDIETGDEPLTIEEIALLESRYPLELESEFASPEDASLADVRRICARTMQMCCHEMLFDCPFYEQQMYPGDTRVQLNVLSAMSRDERMIKRAIELFDLGTRDDGMCPFNWPTRGLQEGASYTLCYLCMFGDYAMNHADRAWLRARLPGLRKSMAGIECYENKDGLLVNLPGWNFMDWAEGWRLGTVPGTLDGEGLVSELNLFWVLAMKSAATTERALGNELQAKYWEEKSARLKRQIVKKFWDGKRGLLADDPEHTSFSEHAQCLALLGDVLSADKAETAFRHLVEDGDLARCTVYFSYYLFETYFKFGRGDLFLKRLGLWRDYIAKGLTTTQEAPDSGKNGQKESRSDCHAWGAHPIWFMQTGLAGIRSDAPFFRRVRIAPCPGGLKSLKASHPHPDGWIKVDLAFDGDDVKGYVDTPVSGVFVYGGREIELKAGHTEL